MTSSSSSSLEAAKTIRRPFPSRRRARRFVHTLSFELFHLSLRLEGGDDGRDLGDIQGSDGFETGIPDATCLADLLSQNVLEFDDIGLFFHRGVLKA